VVHYIKNKLANFLRNKAYFNSRFSDFYFGLISSFQKEHKEVLMGIKKHDENIDNQLECQGKNLDYTLRRNIHRLEKGLITTPRKSIFGLEYIEETLVEYDKCKSYQKSNDNGNELTLMWASSILKEYFNTVSVNPTIQSCIDKYQEYATSSDLSLIPYKRTNEAADVSYEHFLSLCQRRCSTRYYEQKEVPRLLIDKAVDCALQSPSACNRQPFRFCIFDDKDLVEKVSSLPVGAGTFSHQIPSIVVLVGQLRAYNNEADRHTIYVDASLAAMSFELALETLGLSSCSINWRDDYTRTRKMSDLLGLEPDEVVIMLISVGYPDTKGLIPFSQKKSLKEMRTYNQVGN